MSERRPGRGSGPRGTRGPVGPRAARPRAPRQGGVRPTSSAAGTGRGPSGPRPKLTGRAAILIVVVAVLAVSYASSLRAYLQQQAHTSDLRAQIAETTEDIKALEREKRRWKDEAYVEAQARQRFGYVMPGETSYLVIDENGEPLDSPDELADPDSAPTVVPDAWWDTAWGSVEAAGNPEEHLKGPARKIESADPEQDESGQDEAGQDESGQDESGQDGR